MQEPLGSQRVQEVNKSPVNVDTAGSIIYDVSTFGVYPSRAGAIVVWPERAHIGIAICNPAGIFKQDTLIIKAAPLEARKEQHIRVTGVADTCIPSRSIRYRVFLAEGT